MLLLTGIGVFLVGIVKFQALLQKESSEKIKHLFEKMGNNRMVGFGVGAGVTTVIQSSTATTVIVVSLVNAGIMTLSQSTSIIIGANVGSALSNMLLSLTAFRIRYFFMFMVFLGAVTKIATTKKVWNRVADHLIAFGIVFVGLEVMSGAFRGSEYLTNGFNAMFEWAQFPLLLILLGFTLTAIMNSSTAATAIFITLAGSGAIGFVEIMYLVLGSRLGTTLTTLIASIGSTTNAKRAAMMHLFFNLFSTIAFLPFLWPLQHHIADLFDRIIADPIWQVSIFSLVLNILSAAVLLCFIKQINWIVHKVVRDKIHPYVMSEEEVEQAYEEGMQAENKGFGDTF